MNYLRPIYTIAYWEVKTSITKTWIQILFFLFWLFAIIYLFLAQLQFLVESLSPIQIRDFIHWQQRGLILLTAIFGASLIASDREEGAFKLYFSRPLTLSQYLLGKLLSLFFYIYALVFAPAATIQILGYVMQPEEEGRTLFEVCLSLFASFGYTFTLALFLGLFTLWVSAASSTRRGASVLWIFLYFGSELTYEFLTIGLSVYESFTRWMSLLSLRLEVELLGSWIFYPLMPDYVPPPRLPWPYPLAVQVCLALFFWVSTYQKVKKEI